MPPFVCVPNYSSILGGHRVEPLSDVTCIDLPAPRCGLRHAWKAAVKWLVDCNTPASPAANSRYREQEKSAGSQCSGHTLPQPGLNMSPAMRSELCDCRLVASPARASGPPTCTTAFMIQSHPVVVHCAYQQRSRNYGTAKRSPPHAVSVAHVSRSPKVVLFTEYPIHRLHRKRTLVSLGDTWSDEHCVSVHVIPCKPTGSLA